MRTPHSDAKAGDPDDIYEHYTRGRNKRQELKEKLQEQFNDSFSAVPGRPKPIPLARMTQSSGMGSTTPLGHTRMPTAIRQQILELSANSAGRPMGGGGQGSGLTSRQIPHGSRDGSGIGLGSSAVSGGGVGTGLAAGAGGEREMAELKKKTQEKVKGRFDELLNAYFSSLPSKLASPSKEEMSKQQNKMKDAINGLREGRTVRSPAKKEGQNDRSKSPILKFKEQYDSFKHATVPTPPPPPAPRSALSTPLGTAKDSATALRKQSASKPPGENPVNLGRTVMGFEVGNARLNLPSTARGTVTIKYQL
jgi:hypothetical protein